MDVVDLDGEIGAEIGAAVMLMQIDDCSLIIKEVAHNIATVQRTL